VRDTDLKKTIRGYVRNLGRMAQGGQPKFYLGNDRAIATRRLQKIIELWQIVEELHATGTRPGVAVWDKGNLEVAKALAKGEIATVKKRDYEPPERYFQRVNDLRDRLGGEVEPASPFMYRTGQQDILDAIEQERAKLGRGARATGQTLHQALRAYQQSIEREYRDADGTISDNGKTKVNQIRAILSYLPDLDLGSLDFTATDELFGVFRRRPLSTRYRKPMARKSCTNYIGELGRFLRWLHLSGEFAWRKPEGTWLPGL
jgi:hypothetical protein